MSVNMYATLKAYDAHLTGSQDDADRYTLVTEMAVIIAGRNRKAA